MVNRIISFTLLALALLPNLSKLAGVEEENTTARSENITRAEFERRWIAWENYIYEHGIVCSSFAEPYVANKAFGDLVELGPVSVPWFAEMGGFGHDAIHVILRTDWGEHAGIKPDQIPYTDMYAVFDDWWKDAPETRSTKFSAVNQAFRAMLEGTARTTDTLQVRTTEEWRKLRGMGLLGVPSVIERIKSGVADEYDFWLITWWTAPVAYTEAGFPRRPPEPAILSAQQKDPSYWLDWWEKNKWQFWWLIPGIEPPK